MNTFEYHQLLKYIYFEGYADSYEDAEYLLEELNDDEYEELCEKFVKAMDTRGRGPDHRTRFPQFAGRDGEFDPEFTRKRVKVKQDGEPFQNEEFKDLTPEKEERVRNKLGDLARTVQVQGAQVKKLRNKPFAKHRPGIKQQIKDIVKSAKKNANLAQNATDALIRTSVGRSANLQSRINNLRNR